MDDDYMQCSIAQYLNDHSITDLMNIIIELVDTNTKWSHEFTLYCFENNLSFSRIDNVDLEEIISDVE